MTIRILAECYGDPALNRLTLAALPGLDKIEYLEVRPAESAPDADATVRGALAYRVVGPRVVSNDRLARHIADAENALRERSGKSANDALSWDDALKAADRRVDVET
ncbi:MAG: hypothetical protein LBM17_04345 [Candidatus Accumulibacter sp.]|jgi:hypothetical protein|nr:hypothetical protein [Accumulibacter sp.]